VSLSLKQNLPKSLTKILPLPKKTFSLEKNKKFKYNFNTATHDGLKNEIFEFYF
jgi:hypothetical protein